MASPNNLARLLKLLVPLMLLLTLEVGVLADGEDEEPNIINRPCGYNNVTCNMSSTSHPAPVTSRPFERLPSPTERPKKKNAPSDPNKYGLVPPFLIGASSVILIYIITHCLYVHCCAKKKIRTLADQSNTSQTQTNTLVVSDGPSTTSLAVRYDGAYGKTEIINATPYLLCHNSQMPAEVAMCNNQTPVANPSNNTPPGPGGRVASGGGFLAKFKRNVGVTRNPSSNMEQNGGEGRPEEASPRPSLCSADSSGTFNRVGPEGDPASMGSTSGSRGSLCFVPVGRIMGDQKNVRPEFSPLHGIMYNTGSPGGTGGPQDGMKRDSSHTLIFVPVNSEQQYSNMVPQSMSIGPDGTFLPLEGNASNMAVPLIVEDQASDPGSRESSTIEHEALIHDDITLDKVGEHAV